MGLLDAPPHPAARRRIDIDRPGVLGVASVAPVGQDPLLAAYSGGISGALGVPSFQESMMRLAAIRRQSGGLSSDYAAAMFDSPLAPGFGAMGTIDDVGRAAGRIADMGDDVAMRLSKMRLGEQTAYAEDMLRRAGAEVTVDYSSNISQRFGPSQSRYVKGTLPDGRRVEVRISDHADVTGRDGDALNLGIAPSIVASMKEAGVEVPQELLAHAKAQYALRQTLRAEDEARRVARRQASIDSLVDPIMGLGATREEAVEILTTAGKKRYRTILEAIGERTGKNPFQYVAARITKLKQDAGL